MRFMSCCRCRSCGIRHDARDWVADIAADNRGFKRDVTGVVRQRTDFDGSGLSAINWRTAFQVGVCAFENAADVRARQVAARLTRALGLRIIIVTLSFALTDATFRRAQGEGRKTIR